MLQTVCPACHTALSFPSTSTYIQCPKCFHAFSPPQASAPPPQQPPKVAAPANTRYLNCINCSTLLSHPPSSVTIQCPKCLTVMDVPHTATTVHTGAPVERPVVKKKRKDPNAPKRASNAYMVFCKEKRIELKEARPDLPFGQLGKRLGEMWRTMSNEEKRPYEEKALADRDRYKGQMGQYQTESMLKQVAPPPQSSAASQDQQSQNSAASADGSQQQHMLPFPQ